jgi:hypothetical protein
MFLQISEKIPKVRVHKQLFWLLNEIGKTIIRPDKFRRNTVKILGWELWDDEKITTYQNSRDKVPNVN